MIGGDFDVYVARWKTRHADVFEGGCGEGESRNNSKPLLLIC